MTLKKSEGGPSDCITAEGDQPDCISTAKIPPKSSQASVVNDITFLSQSTVPEWGTVNFDNLSEHIDGLVPEGTLTSGTKDTKAAVAGVKEVLEAPT